MIYNQIIGACWIAFFALWFVLAVRRNTGRSTQSPGSIWLRLVLVAAALLGGVLISRFPELTFGRYASSIAGAGCALCVAGLVFGAWARVAIGRSWGMPMTLHEKPELVTAGPYGFVRHPIYTGLSAMAVGTTLVYPVMVLWCVAMLTYLIISARREERDMALRFPDTYPAYSQRSKMLVPFVL